MKNELRPPSVPLRLPDKSGVPYPMALLYPLSSGPRGSAQKWICDGGIGAIGCVNKNSWNIQDTLPPSSQLCMPVLSKTRPLKHHSCTKARGSECRIIQIFLKNVLCSENWTAPASIPYNLYRKCEDMHRCLDIAAVLPRILHVHSDCPQPNFFVHIHLNVRESPRVPVGVSRNFYLLSKTAWRWLTPS